MRPPDAQTCDRDDPRVRCVGRWDATLRGDFRYSFEHRGWLWDAFEGVPWTRCPWCQHRLPNFAAVYARLHKGIYEDD